MQKSSDKQKGRIDWTKIASISKEEIEEQAGREKQELGIKPHASVRPVFRLPDLPRLRARLKLSQEHFALLFGLSPRTIQQWEQKRAQPDQPARILLHLIESQPEVIAHILNDVRKRRLQQPRASALFLDSVEDQYKRSARTTSAVKKGSDNVFADLGLANAKELLAKAELAAAIHKEIKRLGLTQTEAAKILGIVQSRFSALMTGHLDLFSTYALIQYLTALGRDVNISVGNSRGKKSGKVTVALTTP